MDYARLIPIIRRLALEAGDRIMEVYNGPDFEVKSQKRCQPGDRGRRGGGCADLGRACARRFPMWC